MGAGNLKSIEYTGSGVNFAVGQSPGPWAPWPRFNVKSYALAVNYETALAPAGGGPVARGRPGVAGHARWARRVRSSW